MKRLRLMSSILAVVAALLSPGAAMAQPAPQPIVFLTDAGPLGRHSLFFVAKEKGYYKAEGLDVDIRGGRGSAATIREVAAGAAAFGFADAGTLILSRANENAPAKMVGIVYARAPHAMMALKSSGIKSVKDLPGRTLADTSASSNYILFPAYARANGVDPDSVKWVFTDFNSLPGLLITKQVDAIGQFVMGAPMLKQRAPNDDIVVLAYKDSGMEFYSNVVVASDATIQSNPDLVRRFMRATQKGMHDAFANPDEAARLMSKDMPMLDKGIIASETRAVGELAKTPETEKDGLGVLNEAKVAQTIEMMAKNFKLTRTPGVAEVSFMTKF